MPTTAGTQNNAGDLFNSLLELCHDLRAGHEAALNVIKRETALALVHQGIKMLDSQVARLHDPALRLSQNASNTPDARALLERAKVRVAGWIGERAVIGALLGSVEDLAKAFERAKSQANLPEPARFLAKQLTEEIHRHADELRLEMEDFTSNRAEKSQDHDEVTRGRAMPRTDAQAARLNNSTDY